MERSHINRHRRSASAGRQGENLCSRHNSPLDAYCCTDDQVICADCAKIGHTGHTIGLVREERRRKQDELKKLKLQCLELLRRQEKERNKTQMLDQIEEKARQTDDFCEAVLTRIIALLQTHYMSIRELIQSKHNAAVNSIKAQKQQAKEVKKRCSELDRLAHTDSDIHFLLGWPTLRQLCEKDLKHESTDNLFLPFESMENAVDDFGNQLEEFCNNKFASITQNDVIATDHQEMEEVTEDDYQQQMDEDSYDVYEVTNTGIQFAEPRTKDDFRQYACDLTLDPSTAHEDLFLSRDLKEVRLAPQSTRCPAVRYPERFLYRRQVLCREGLQGEHCYYEIEVTGGNAEIALAYKGIDRKAGCSNRRSAFGANAKSWSLDRSTHYNVSHNGDSVELTSVPGHKRIGVYLRFKEGTVSFYEVSDTMKFLYKLEAAFTEPLYPGFWVGENCRIRICDLTHDPSLS